MYRYNFKTNDKSEEPVASSITFNALKDSLFTRNISSPFHSSIPLRYHDYTASGRASRLVEEYLLKEVIPIYGNTHSLTTATAKQMTWFRSESRHILRSFFNLTEDNVVIFSGNGATGAAEKFFKIYEKQAESEKYTDKDRWGCYQCLLCKNTRFKSEVELRAHCNTSSHKTNLLTSSAESKRLEKTVFFVDPWGHHSIILPARELASKHPHKYIVVELDSASFDSQVRSYPDFYPVLLLTVVSNITGDIRKYHELSEIVHKHKGIACWDCAAVAGHFRLDVNPVNRKDAYADFVFLSPHKLLGGVGGSGVLLARKHHLTNQIPSSVGGGTVYWVDKESELYIADYEEREEAGTPNILADIRAGMAYLLHLNLDGDWIFRKEKSLLQLFLDNLQEEVQLGRIQILGDRSNVEQKCAIVSFTVKSTEGINLHHNYIVTLLNDIFGIQSRAGCACAGPFSQELLGLSKDRVQLFKDALVNSGQEIYRPGFIRLGFHFTDEQEDVLFISKALKWICKFGQRLLCLYKVDLVTGEFKYKDDVVGEKQRIWLSNLGRPCIENLQTEVFDLKIVLRNIEDSLQKYLKHEAPALPHLNNLELVWFLLPCDSNGLDSRIRRCSLQSEAQLVNDIPETSIQSKIVEEGQQNILLNACSSSLFRKISKLVSLASIELEMIKPNDKILVAVSGGKDSLTLVHVLVKLRAKLPFKIEIGAVTIDPITPEFQPAPLAGYFESLDVPYFLVKYPIMELAKQKLKGTSICAFCARLKRGLLYSTMKEQGYNVLAMGQHADDLCESFLMSAMRNGHLGTMKGNYEVKEKSLRVIRPLIYVREHMTDAFSRMAQLPVIKDNCPACFTAPKERRRMKVLLSQEELENPNVVSSLLNAMKPLIAKGVDDEEDLNAELVMTQCGSDGISCPIVRT
jgi:selenocysteine lyase/cysteine desulfurase/tRNA(Ile)-lysidine synthase TilS/MesJ